MPSGLHKAISVWWAFHNPLSPESQRGQVPANGFIQCFGLRHLRLEGGREPLHLLLEGLAVVLLCLGADVAARGEHMAMLAYLLQRGALAEPRHVPVSLTPALSSRGEGVTGSPRQEW